MNFLSSEHIRDYPGGKGAEPEPREEQHLGQGRQVASLNTYLIRITYRTQLLYNVCPEKGSDQLFVTYIHYLSIPP